MALWYDVVDKWKCLIDEMAIQYYAVSEDRMGKPRPSKWGYRVPVEMPKGLSNFDGRLLMDWIGKPLGVLRSK